jgi:hypothetical protein
LPPDEPFEVDKLSAINTDPFSYSNGEPHRNFLCGFSLIGAVADEASPGSLLPLNGIIFANEEESDDDIPTMDITDVLSDARSQTRRQPQCSKLATIMEESKSYFPVAQRTTFEKSSGIASY